MMCSLNLSCKGFNIVNIIYLHYLIAVVEAFGQNKRFDSKLPAYPATDFSSSSKRRAPTRQTNMSSVVPVPPPQNFPVGPGPGPTGFGGPGPFGGPFGNPFFGGPFGGPLGPGPLGGPFGVPPGPEDFVPFGLNHIILIIVPQFKTKFRTFPGWIDSSVKISMPISVFFDKLEVGPPFPPPGGPVPPPPGGLPPPAGGGPPPPGGVGAAGSNSTGNENMGYPYYGAYPYANFDDDDDSDLEEDADTDTESFESDNNYYSADEDRALRRKKRKKRQILSGGKLIHDPDFQIHKIRKRSVPFNRTVHSAERAVLLPKLENMLESAGLGGKPCLLRTICEVHEAPLNHYGLLGELFTMFFSVSRSIFAESHLPDHLHAEIAGRAGDCSKYYAECDKTIFSWHESTISVNDL